MTNVTKQVGNVRVSSGAIGIEFALWVLTQDGLHAPPFNKHARLNGILQQNGAEGDSWNQWLKLIAIGNDDRLSWHTENIEEEAHKKTDKNRNSLEGSLVNNDEFFDELWYEQRTQEYRNQLQEQEQEYREAIADYPGLDLATIYNSTPPQLWKGNQQSQAIINQMWDEYQLVHCSNSHIHNYFIEPTMEQVQSHIVMENNALGFRKINLLTYIEEVVLFVPPVNIIVTVKDAPINARSVGQRMIDAVRFSIIKFIVKN